MKKAALIILTVFSLATINSFATPHKDKGKKDKCTKACTEKSCCKKPSKAAMLKAKPKANIKKAA